MYKVTELKGDRWNSEISVKHGFLQNCGHNSTYRYDSSTCEQPRADKLQLYRNRQTRSLLLRTNPCLWLDWSGSQDTYIGNVEKYVCWEKFHQPAKQIKCEVPLDVAIS